MERGWGEGYVAWGELKGIGEGYGGCRGCVDGVEGRGLNSQ